MSNCKGISSYPFGVLLAFPTGPFRAQHPGLRSVRRRGCPISAIAIGQGESDEESFEGDPPTEPCDIRAGAIGFGDESLVEGGTERGGRGVPHASAWTAASARSMRRAAWSPKESARPSS